MGDEIELKRLVTPGEADALQASGLLQGDPEVAKQISIYFDTPDHALSKMGFSLRIRRSGKKHIQTIKSDGASADGPGATAQLGMGKKKVLLEAAVDAQDVLLDAKRFWQ